MSRNEDIIAMHAAGIPSGIIAAAYDLTRQRVFQIVQAGRPEHFARRKDHADILALASTGKKSIPEIAAETGVSKGIVRYVTSSHGIKGLPKHTTLSHTRVREAILAMAGPKVTVAEIAKAVGCSQQLVRNVAKEHGLTLSRKHAR